MDIFDIKKIYLLVIFICLIPSGLFAYEMDECISCHSNNPGQGIPQIPAEDYKSSVHGRMMLCTDCHFYIDEEHEGGDVTGTVNCGNCHAQKNLHGALSEKENQLKCYSCHTKHNILPSYIEKSSVHEKQFKKLCVECHKAQWGESGYLKWFTSLRVRSHKKQDFSKQYDETNCVGCHQKIEIHEKTEKLSDDECFKCHMKDNKNAMIGKFHTAGNSGSSVKVLSIITQILILAVLLSLVRFFIKPMGKSGKGEA